MSQHDYIISNDTGANVRSDLNNALGAIATINSGATEPSTTYAYQLWMDTSSNVLKIRNSANSAWYTLPISPIANNTVDINGGTVDGATINSSTIGASSAAAGTFTNLTATGTVTLNQSTIDGLTVGQGAGNVATNTAVGKDALDANTSGAQNTSVGANSLSANSSGGYNVAVGSASLFYSTTSSGNTAVGYAPLFNNTTGASNVAIGRESLFSNTTASSNTAVGYQSGYANTTGKDSVHMGRGAGIAQTTAVANTFVGTAAGGGVTTGSYNTFVGSGEIGVTGGAGEYVTTGSKNTILGRYNGNQGGLDIRTSSNNIVLSDGDGNPRMLIDSSGNWMVGKTAAGGTLNGIHFINSGNNSYFVSSHNSTNASLGTAYFNRNASDGSLIYFQQADSNEGSISVSGTTVSYNGGHLARWSQLPDDSKDETIVKGTVMTNLDAMCEWTHEATEDKEAYTEDNEQLNRMVVSSVEGDTNVAGVFVNWDIDEDAGFNDMNIAMTGDMVIRIAQGVTVNRGDLLMSAGDGTAKPQEDDIVRSKTIAKVTSTHVSHTYDDGSYLVPCVLMAC